MRNFNPNWTILLVALISFCLIQPIFSTPLSKENPVNTNRSAISVDSFSLDLLIIVDGGCDGVANATVGVQIEGGSTPFQYAWSNGSTSEMLENIPAGNYMVTVTDATNCVVIDSFSIENITPLSVRILERLPASGPTTANGAASAGATGGTAPYTFSWSNGLTGEANLALLPGTHSVTVTDSNGCTAIARFSTIFSQLNIVIGDSRNARCFGSSDGFATVETADGVRPYTYLWSNGDTTARADRLSAGEYSVTVTDQAGSTGTISLLVSEGDPIYFNATLTQPTCPTASNGWVRMFASGGREPYLYDIGIGITPVGIIGGVPSGTKRYRVFSADGCTADTVFTLEPLSPGNPIPSFEAVSSGTTVSLTNTSGNEPTEYFWDFGDSTTSTMISPVHQYPDTGNYILCLTATNFCGSETTCDSLSFVEGQVPTVSIRAGRDTAGLQGTIIQIPVMAGAFDDLTSIQGTFGLSNPSVAEIVSFDNFNLPGLGEGNFSIIDNEFSLNWFTVDTNGVSLEPGTVLFTIGLNMIGAPGTCTQIVGNNNVLPLDFSRQFEGEIVSAPFAINSGAICVSRSVAIGGNIRRELNAGLGGVVVAVNATDSTLTTPSGDYNLGGFASGIDYTITPRKEDDLLAGVTTFDLVRILQHILTQAPLETSYRVIAADIDRSNTVNSLDLVYLQQLILEKRIDFPNGAPWRFVPETYMFNNPINPFTEDFPEFLTLDRVALDEANANFIAIKVGDVVFAGNRTSAKLMPNAFPVHTKDSKFKQGEKLIVPLTFDAKEAVLGFQMGLNFDPSLLEFSGIKANNQLGLNEQNIGIKAIEHGKLKLVWLNTQGKVVEENAQSHFQLEFIAKKTGRLSQALSMDEQNFKSEIYSKEARQIALQKIQLDFGTNELELATTLQEEDIDTPVFESRMMCETLTLDSTFATASCAGQGQGSFRFVAAGGTPPYTYDLNGGTSVTGSYTGLFAGTYFLAIADAEDCQYLDTIAIELADATPVFEFTISGISLFLTDVSTNNPSAWSWDIGMIATSDIPTPALNIAGIEGDFEICLTTTNACGTGTSCQTLVLGDTSGGGTTNGDTTGGTTTGGDTTGGTTTGGTTTGGTTTGGTTTGGTTTGGTTTGGDTTGGTTTGGGTTEPITVSVTSRDADCALDNGSIILVTSGGESPYTYTWSDTTLSGTFLTGLRDGTYRVTVTDAMGNTEVSTTIIGKETLSIDMENSIFLPDCLNDDIQTGTIQFVALGGTSPYTYELSGANGILISPTGLYTNLESGSYALTITDVNGCAALFSLNLPGIDAGPVTSFTATQSGSDLTLLDSSMGNVSSWSWTFGTFGRSLDQNPILNVAGVNGAIEICLTTTNACGAATSCQTITIEASNTTGGTTTGGDTTGGTTTGGDTTGGTTTGGDTTGGTTTGGDTTGDTTGGTTTGGDTTGGTGNGGDTTGGTTNGGSEALDALIVAQGQSCAGGDGAITVTPFGGQTPYSYAWSLSSLVGNMPSGLGSGGYNVTITDAAGASIVRTAVVDPSPVENGDETPAFEFTINDTDINFTDISTNIPTSWSWTFGTIATSDMQNPGLNASGVNGPFEVCLTTTNACGMGTTCQTLMLGGNTGGTTTGGDTTGGTTTGGDTTGGTTTGGTTTGGTTTGGTTTGGTTTGGTTTGGTTTGGTTTGGTTTGGTTTGGTTTGGTTGGDTTGGTTNGGEQVLDAIIMAQGHSCAGGDGAITVTASGGQAPYSYAWSVSSLVGNMPTGLSTGGYNVTITDAAGASIVRTAVVDPSPVENGDETPAFEFTINNTDINFTDVSTNIPTSWAWTFGNIATSPMQNPGLNGSGLNGPFEVCLTTTNACGTGTVCQTLMLGDDGGNTTGGTTTGGSTTGGTTTGGDTTGGTTTGGTTTGGTTTGGTTTGGTTTGGTTTGGTTTGGDTTGGTTTGGTTTGGTTTGGVESITLSIVTQNASCIGNDGAITINVTGGQSPYTYAWSVASLTGNMPTGVSAGGYNVTVIDANGLTALGTAVVEIGMVGLDRTASQFNPTCSGIGTGSLNLVATGGTAPYTFDLNGGGSDTGIYEGLFAGTYFLTIQDANGCSGMDTIMIETGDAMPTFEITANGTDIAFTDLSTNNPTSWSWNFGNIASSDTQNPGLNATGLTGPLEICLTTVNDCGTGTSCQTLMLEGGTTGGTTTGGDTTGSTTGGTTTGGDTTGSTTGGTTTGGDTTGSTTGGTTTGGDSDLPDPVSLTIDNLIKVTTDTVLVPVRASKFINVLSYQHSIQLSDTLQSRIIGVSGFNLEGLAASNFYQVNNYSLTTAWFDATAMGLSVPDGTILYQIQVVKNNLASDCIELAINGSIIPMQVITLQNGVVTEAELDINNGNICASGGGSLFGNITRETGQGVAEVQVDLTNNVGQAISETDGFYSFDTLALGLEFDIVPSKTTDILEDVSTFDIVLINRHILAITDLDSPYKLIAADVNASNSITIFDIVLIQRAILGLNADFPNNTSWRFIPANYEFPDPTDPFADPLFPELIAVDGFVGNLMNQDFIAVKVADVSYTVGGSLQGVSEARSNNALVLNLPNQHFEQGELLDIPITTFNLAEFEGFQMEFNFDPNILSLEEFNPAPALAFGTNNWSYQYVQRGKILMTWLAPVNTSTIGNQVFDIRFKARRAGSIKGAISLSEEFVKSEAYTKDLQVSAINFNFEENTIPDFEAITIYPNPSKGLIELQIPATNSQLEEITVFNITGQQIVQRKQFEEGLKNIQLDLSGQPEGTYLLVMKSKEGIEMRRVVIAK